ncbi:extracellular solute-binding protein [Candidatus Fermentibacteria bacterium]|nr:extracellular solute-binding protein [Candidatus Fermentibacteria bacterium]
MLFLILAAPFLPSCRPDGGRTSGQTVRVVFWHAMGGPLGELLEDSLVAEFNATHPGIEVVAVSMGNYRALSQKIMASVMAGEPPVLAQAYETWTAQLIDGGVLVPLDSMMAQDREYSRSDWARFYEVFRKNNTFGERVYSFPFNKSVPALYYNADLFDSLGLAPPSTWQQHRELLRTLSYDGNGDGDLLDDCDRWGTAFTVSVWMFENLLAQNGGTLLSPDGRSTAFAQTEGVEALGFLVELLHRDGTAYLSSGYEHQREFTEGRVAMVQGSVVSLSFMQRDMQRRAESGLSTFEIAVAPLPSNRRRAVFIAGTNVVLFADHGPDRTEAAWEFVKWFTEPEQQARWFAGTGYLPVSSTALRQPVARRRLSESRGLEEVVAQLDYARFEPQISAWYNGREFLSEAVEIALYGRMGPEEALARAAELADEEMETER